MDTKDSATDCLMPVMEFKFHPTQLVSAFENLLLTIQATILAFLNPSPLPLPTTRVLHQPGLFCIQKSLQVK